MYEEIIIEILVIDLNFQVGNFPIQSIIFPLLLGNRGFHLTYFLQSAASTKQVRVTCQDNNNNNTLLDDAYALTVRAVVECLITTYDALTFFPCLLTVNFPHLHADDCCDCGLSLSTYLRCDRLASGATKAVFPW